MQSGRFSESPLAIDRGSGYFELTFKEVKKSNAESAVAHRYIFVTRRLKITKRHTGSGEGLMYWQCCHL